MTKKEVLRRLRGKKGVLLKHGARTCGKSELHWGHEQWPIVYFVVVRGQVSREFGSRFFRTLRGLAVVGKTSIITV